MFWILLPFAALLLPVIPLLLASLLSFPIMYLVSFLRKRQALALVASLVGFLILFGLYFVGISALNSIGSSLDGEEFEFVLITESTRAIIEGFRHAYPINFLSQAMMNGSLLHLLYFILSTAGLLGVSLLIAQLLYKRSVIAGLESSGHSKSSSTDIFAKLRESATDPQENLDKSLLTKEFKLLSRELGFAFQSYLGVLAAPIFIFLFGTLLAPVFDFSSIDIEGEELPEFMGSLFFISMGLFMILIFLGGTNYTAYVAFTREGKYFYMNKYLPVPYERLFRIKSLFATLVSATGIVLSSIAFIIVLALNGEHILNAMLQGILLTGVVIPITYSLNKLGVIRDLRRPKLNWSNMQEALKNNLYASVPTFIALAAGFVIMIAGSIISFLSPFLHDALLYTVFWFIAYASAAVIYLLFGRNNPSDNIDYLFERIQC
jgi:ABC-2 type transport system permease protein